MEKLVLYVSGGTCSENCYETTYTFEYTSKEDAIKYVEKHKELMLKMQRRSYYVFYNVIVYINDSTDILTLDEWFIQNKQEVIP